MPVFELSYGFVIKVRSPNLMELRPRCPNDDRHGRAMVNGSLIIGNAAHINYAAFCSAMTMSWSGMP